MRTKIGALVATVAAAASAAGAAVWASRKRDGDEFDAEAAHGTQATTGRSDEPADDDGAAQAPAIAASDGQAALTSLKGLGARSAERLADVGVTTLAQIATWTDTDIEEIAPQIHVNAERIRREDWVGQARAAVKD